MLKGRHYFSDSVSTARGGGDLGGPSGLVPGSGEVQAVREKNGPDCVLFPLLRVLSAYFRDYYVILSLLSVLLFELVLLCYINKA